MQVKAITPRGYCKGVVRAIEMAKKARDEKKPIVILGMIVHNQYIVDALKEMGIETIDHPRNLLILSVLISLFRHNT